MNLGEGPVAASAPLTLVRAAAVRPPRTSDVAQWREEVGAAYVRAEPSPYRGLTEMLFAQTGERAAALCERIPVPLETNFRDARGETQGELALQALAALVKSLPDAVALQRCKLAVYAAASVDEHFFRSTISSLGARFGFSSLPHFALSQLQGASLTAAVELIAAMLRHEGEGALLIVAEAWPTPFPRLCDVPSVLGDGAAALWFERRHRAGLRLVGSRQQSFDPFVAQHTDSGEAMPSILMQDLLDAAAEVIERCIDERGVAKRDIAGWISSGISTQCDGALRERLGIEVPLIVEPRSDDGYLCAAASGVLVADLLERAAAGAIADGTLVLSWGASFGGGIGVALWRVAHPKESA
jgi:hypothetical protein